MLKPAAAEGDCKDPSYLTMATGRPTAAEEAEANNDGGDSPSRKFADEAVRSAARRNEGFELEEGAGGAKTDVFSTDVYILPEAVHKSCRKLASRRFT